MQNLKGLTIREIEDVFLSISEPKFRAKQLCEWVYQKRVTDFFKMTNFSKNLREKLAADYYIDNLKRVKTSRSTLDGTIKYLFETADGERIESVFIPDQKRYTICISTQVGCALGCQFCLTGDSGVKRNLDVSEIVDQIMMVQNELPSDKAITNVVFMGMGEPLLNYDHTIKAVEIINAAWGLGIGARKITISTAGIVPAIYRLAKENLSIRLAISLNAPDDKLRSELMPINKKYPLAELIAAAKEFSKSASRFLTFEYILMKGVNDTVADAEKLIALLNGIDCKINLIAYNENEYKNYRKSPDMNIFLTKIEPHFKAVTIRKSGGSDILAACGQLRAKE